MSILIPILSVAVLGGVLLGLLPREKNRSFANSLIGTHKASLTRMSDGVVATRYLLGTNGSDALHVAVCGANNVPVGIICDEASAAEEELAVSLLGAAPATLRMVAAGTIAAGSLVYTAASGKVGALPTTSGTYYCVGIALTAAAASGDVIEVDPCVAQKVVVS
jgi:hypothetical protein